MHPPAKPWWQQVTALVSLSVGGGIAGFNFVPKAPADLTSPASMPIHLMALEQAAQPAPGGDAMLRAAIVHVASYYLRMAAGKSPAEMEAIIWQHDSIDGVDHGASCAAFASLTLELGSQIVGQQSWVTGGTSYPWPMHQWADVRVDPNPQSPGIVSVLQDAEAHGRWHPLGGGYEPQPGDWVMFDGHVEVVTKYADGVLHTIGGDSVPNYSVNAHQYGGSLAADGVQGFVNNGEVAGTAAQAPAAHHHVSTHHHAGTQRDRAQASGAAQNAPVIPGLEGTTALDQQPPHVRATPHASHYTRHQPPPTATPLPVPDAQEQQAFIREVAPGAMAAQRTYGVPAAVTIAQAIDESGWGMSKLATRDHNLFGIKGTGPAGSDSQPSQEYLGGHLVTRIASFRVYHNAAESIADHARLIATSGFYGRAMAVHQDADAFAGALTGVYATDPGYGTKLVDLMQHFDLYRFDGTSHVATPPTARATSPAPAHNAPGTTPPPTRHPAPPTRPPPPA
ncbi:MAG TPA: glucosaminidase domain-containing protein, partial [Streptosporangiaceae bacterium]|nr:glucosaminidase domain-containing protein [Streptosporangiaceae bacterium]